MAGQTGYTKNYLSAVETGREKLTATVVEAYERALNLPTGSLGSTPEHAAPVTADNQAHTAVLRREAEEQTATGPQGAEPSNDDEPPHSTPSRSTGVLWIPWAGILQR